MGRACPAVCGDEVRAWASALVPANRPLRSTLTIHRREHQAAALGNQQHQNDLRFFLFCSLQITSRTIWRRRVIELAATSSLGQQSMNKGVIAGSKQATARDRTQQRCQPRIIIQLDSLSVWQVEQACRSRPGRGVMNRTAPAFGNEAISWWEIARARPSQRSMLAEIGRAEIRKTISACSTRRPAT